MTEPTWLSRAFLDSLHADQIREHGGAQGVLNTGMIESALARPVDKWHYGAERDLFNLAAAYGFGLAKNHGYQDGNKRTALMAMYVFLDANGLELNASEVDAVAVITDLAGGKVSESELAQWLRTNSISAE
jgi:death on curing protein